MERKFWLKLLSLPLWERGLKLVLWDDLNKTALAYWRELGLTPSSYKKLTGTGAKQEESKKGLAAALASIES